MWTNLSSVTVEEQPTSPPTKKRAVRALLIVGILAAAVGAYQLAFRVALATDSPFFVVVSESMVPTLHVGDELVVRGEPFASLQVKDIIVFHNPAQRFDSSLRHACLANPEDIPCVIVHRVFSISDENGRMVTTKGDANSRPDPIPVVASDYIGKVIYSIPYVGSLSVLIRYPYNFVLIGAVLVFVFITEFLPSERRRKTT